MGERGESVGEKGGRALGEDLFDDVVPETLVCLNEMT